MTDISEVDVQTQVGPSLTNRILQRMSKRQIEKLEKIRTDPPGGDDYPILCFVTADEPVAAQNLPFEIEEATSESFAEKTGPLPHDIQETEETLQEVKIRLSV